LRLWGIAAAWFLLVSTAHANCSSPSAAEGSLDYNTSTHVFQYCDNTSTWLPLVSGGGGGYADHVISGTTNVYVNSATSTISFTTNGSVANYFNSSGVLVTTGISVTTNQFSATTALFSTGQTINGVALRSGSSSGYTAYSVGRTSAEAYLGVAAASGNWVAGSTAGDMGVNSLAFGYNDGSAATFKVVFAANGNVGLGGQTNPQAALDVSGSIFHSGIITDLSDRRMKLNVQPLPSTLQKILSLMPVSYRKKMTPTLTEFGFIAQDVLPIFSDLVTTANDPSKTMSLNYIGLMLGARRR
jgi:hypothetical protein